MTFREWILVVPTRSFWQRVFWGSDPAGQEVPQPGPQGPALAGRPLRHEAGDVCQAHPDARGPADERQLRQR
jgi:hypothetical protein